MQFQHDPQCVFRITMALQVFGLIVQSWVQDSVSTVSTRRKIWSSLQKVLVIKLLFVLFLHGVQGCAGTSATSKCIEGNNCVSAVYDCIVHTCFPAHSSDDAAQKYIKTPNLCTYGTGILERVKINRENLYFSEAVANKWLASNWKMSDCLATWGQRKQSLCISMCCEFLL